MNAFEQLYVSFLAHVVLGERGHARETTVMASSLDLQFNQGVAVCCKSLLRCVERGMDTLA